MLKYALNISLVILSLCATSQAQSKSFDCLAGKALSAKETDAEISKVQQSYSGMKSMQAVFAQDSFVAALEISELSTGKVLFSKPGKMKWSYASPEEQVFLVRDQTLWFYQKRENQLLIDDFKNVLISDLPVAFLMGLGNLKNDFNVLRACRGTDGTIFELSAKSDKNDRAKELKSFELLVGEGGLPHGARIRDAGGNSTAIVFTDVVANPVIPDAAFSPDFPKGGDINDRRKERQSE